jgi:hypothetical protein
VKKSDYSDDGEYVKKSEVQNKKKRNKAKKNNRK